MSFLFARQDIVRSIAHTEQLADASGRLSLTGWRSARIDTNFCLKGLDLNFIKIKRRVKENFNPLNQRMSGFYIKYINACNVLEVPRKFPQGAKLEGCF